MEALEHTEVRVENGGMFQSSLSSMEASDVDLQTAIKLSKETADTEALARVACTPRYYNYAWLIIL